jgi:hypothetical protein
LEARGLLLRLLKGDSDDPLAGSVRLGEGSELHAGVPKDAWDVTTDRRLASVAGHLARVEVY